ncbi:hypothetical protein [Streptomyces tubercidicus]|uniref:hypothetical protein n=1 Tax=Streptomyces tubercidicus TaxID=47759 RepID=UPI0037B8514B
MPSARGRLPHPTGAGSRDGTQGYRGALDTAQGWTPELVRGYAERVPRQAARQAPDLHDRILAVDVITPEQLARHNPNAIEGDPYGGSLELDQSFLWRPLPSSGRHATAVRGPWHIGASTHPGAGLGGSSGHMYGGTCPNVGCVPTKALVHRSGKRRPEDPPQEWYERSVQETQAITKLFRGGNYEALDGMDTVTVLTGHGRFRDPDTVVVDTGTGQVTVTGATILYLRTSRPHIYALGDVNGGPQFTYISLDDSDDSRIVLDQLTGEGSRSTADRVAIPHTVFMTPPLATVGLTEKEARAAGHRVKVGSQAVADIVAMPRAYVVEETRGMMKFVMDADTDEILGAALLGVDAQELINTVALAVRHRLKAADLRNAVYTHPSDDVVERLGGAAIVRIDEAQTADV